MNDALKQIVALALGCLGSLAVFADSARAASLLLDQDFRPPLFAEPIPAQRVLLLPDGKFLVFYTTETLTDQRTGAITRYQSDGTLDTSFSFTGDYKSVSAAAPTATGQLIIAAIQYTYGIAFGSEHILRLNTDGSVDSTFNAQLVHPDAYTTVRRITLQPDGKILVAGSFDTFAGVSRKDIVRLLPDGTPDSTFTPPTISGGFYGIYARPVVVDNKILIAGDFSSINSIPSLGVARLNADGSLDSTFQASGFIRYNTNTPIRGLAVQSDGKILTAGRFRIGTGPGAPRMPLLRLNTDGSLDSSYAYSTALGPNAFARDLLLQPDGKAVAAVDSSVYRFDTTGPLDSTFTAPSLIDTTYYLPGYGGTPTAVNLQPDGRIIVGGVFTDVNPAGTPDGSHFGLARLNSDGTLDPTLVVSHRTGMEDFPSSFARLPDGSTLVSFHVESFRHDPAMPFNVGRLFPNGSVDPSFSLSSSDPGGILSMEFFADDFIQLSDSEFLAFDQYYGLGGKFFSSGVQDLAFDLAGAFQKAVVAQNGRSVLAAGTDPQATIFGPLQRIRRDGSYDPTFSPPASIYEGQVIRDSDFTLAQLYVGSHVLAVQPNGKILFLYFWSDSLFHLVRLNANGSLDETFATQTVTPSAVFLDYPVVFDPYNGAIVQPYDGSWSAPAPFQDTHIQADGKILICGPFTSFNGTPAKGLVRLLSDGTVDSTFDPGGGAQWTKTTETASFFPFVEAIEEQVDGKLLIAGTFEAFDGNILPGIASLNPNGSVDTSFVPPVGRLKFSPGTTRLAKQSDGSFLLSGPYAFPGENHPTFIHLNSVGGIPVIGGPPEATAVVGQPFSYQITASGQPTSYVASGLPTAFTIDTDTGLITGTPTSSTIGVYAITMIAENKEGTSTPFHLTLSVVPAQVGPLPTLRNISTRLKVLTAENTLIGGFIITGWRSVIIRGIGPSLTSVGISGALADPVLELHGPVGFVTVTNDNWRDTQQSEIEATGIAPTNDLESAIVATLPPGAYTAMVSGKNGGTGVGLVEVYDLDSSIDAQLANISTRGFVDTGENVMIGGLIAGPTDAGSGRALVRAIGPSLTAFGVPNALQDPTLELHDANGELIGSNNDWRDTQEAAIEATGVAPTDNHEAAILTVLSPGSFTAVVQGANGGTGVGLVEVYNLE